jgi:hypothetical protein
MSQTQVKKVKTKKDELQIIANNIAQMRREKNYLEVRQMAITRALRQVERNLNASDDIEEVQSLQEIVDNLCAIGSDLETHRSHLETELDKVSRGVETLSTLRGKPGRKAFAAYITEDTEISVRDLAQVRSYYDQVVMTLKKLKDETLT